MKINKTISNYITSLLSLSFIVLVTMAVMNAIFGQPAKKAVEEATTRIELQFSDTEMRLFEIEKDLNEIGSRIDSLEVKIDKLFENE